MDEILDDAIICTWNPAKWEIPESVLRDAQVITRRGEIFAGDWSVGRRRRGLGPGDPVYLFRQGREGRGIVARGTLTSEPFEEDHWDGSASATRYVEIDWDVWLPEQGLLPVERLEAEIPAGNWGHRYQSGYPLNGPEAKKLDRLFAEHLTAIGWP